MRSATRSGAQVGKVDATTPVASIRTVESYLNAGQTALLQYVETLLGIFALVALVASAVGVYALTAYGVAHRQSVLALGLFVVAAVAIGAAAGWAGWARLASVIASFLTNLTVTPSDPMPLVVTGGVILMTALVVFLVAGAASDRGWSLRTGGYNHVTPLFSSFRRSFMLRRIPTYLLLAAFVTSGSALAARTEDQAAGRATSQPPENPRRRPLAVRARSPLPAPVTPADAAPLMGTWQIPLETPTGRLVANIAFRIEAGKVVAGLSAPQFQGAQDHRHYESRPGRDAQGIDGLLGPPDGVLGSRDDGVDVEAEGTGPRGMVRLQQLGFQIGGTAKKRS